LGDLKGEFYEFFGAKYVHTNLVAKDWRKLSAFYQTLFDCVPVPPERDLSGDPMDAGTGIPDVHVWGEHLRLPGYGSNGPTLEIFNYNKLEECGGRSVNRPGFGHIAFSVEDVKSAREAVLAAGGSPVGEVVTVQIATGARVTWCYLADPEGNILELQSWLNPTKNESQF
jgi:predicted enzyme related to lactoylglutathione lyase